MKTTRKVLCKNEEIISVGNRHYPLLSEKYTIYELNSFEWIKDKNKHELKNINGKAVLKTDNELKLEKLNKLQSEVFSKLKDINIAIACQEITNKILKEDEETEIYTISKEDIKTIGKYQNTIATFHINFNPNDYTLEEINETIFNQDLVLPEIITRLL